MTDLPPGVSMIDALHLGRPHVIAAYLLTGDAPALVDPGPASTLPAIEAGLAAHGLTIDDLHAVLLTHIHLDHAGAAGTLARRNPRLRVYVHQRGAPHLIAPERLINSAQRIYGDQMAALWGEFLPLPADRLSILHGGETIQLGSRRIEVLDAPGHASHHVVYLEPAFGSAWVGDIAGARLPGANYIQPATPPPDIDLEAWRATIDTLLAMHPQTLLLTHFGPSGNPAHHFAELWQATTTWADVVRSSLAHSEDEATAIARLQLLTDQALSAAPAAVRAEYAQAASVAMSWHGLARYWRKRTA
ncbi:MAG TPA: MBL fold metallo-hydrolase [Roseiflexaceae bacterium]|nr:MBL fold metallo-hydrolase [Roseiflexaceae bacterium]HMP38957.1 MBL fold metallo-hydrolase [Roseiflexaceae bacterium]